jgi:hypothetical protein
LLGWDTAGRFGYLEIRYDDGRGGYSVYFLELWRADIEGLGFGNPCLARSVAFAHFPLATDSGVEYFSDLDVVYGGEDPAFDNIQAYDLWLRGSDGSAKLVGSAEPRAVHVQVAGYFPSPFENRIAVVLLEERYSFEGTELFPVIFGSNMSVGFQPAEN